MTLESLVRPFAAPQTLGTRRVIPSSTKKEPQTAGVTWGKAGTLPSARQSDADGPANPMTFNTQTKKVKVRQVEKSRKEETVRIEQPGNPDNWVEVKRLKSVIFEQENPVALRGPPSRGRETVAFAPPPGLVTIDSISISVPKAQPTDGLIALDPTEYTLTPPVP